MDYRQEIRVKALELALGALGVDAQVKPQYVVEVAREFEKYLSGEGSK